MVLRCNRRNSKGLLCVTLLLILLYIPLNILNVFRIYIHEKGSSKKDGAVPIKLKDIIPQGGGSVDVVLSMDMNQLLKLVDATLKGTFNGEFTANPLPMNTTFVLNNADACKNLPHLQYIIYVHSAPGNIERRRVIRSTWASHNLFKTQISKLVFLMGTPTDVKELNTIKEEHKLYGDIIQGSFIENYQNLTLKAIMGLKWVSQYCSNAPYALKADDDAFVNIFELMKIVEKEKDKKRMIICPLWKENTMPILRDPTKCMKWCVKYNEFPGRTHFPKYCAGLTFLMSRDIIPKMYQASLSTPFFWIDDVYITGILATKVQDIEYIDLLQKFTLKEVVAFDEYLSKDPVTHIFAHVKKPPYFYKMWNATLNRLGAEELKQIGEPMFNEYKYLKDKLNKR